MKLREKVESTCYSERREIRNVERGRLNNPEPSDRTDADERRFADTAFTYHKIFHDKRCYRHQLTAHHTQVIAACSSIKDLQESFFHYKLFAYV